MKVIVFEPSYSTKQRKILRSFARGIPGAKVKPLGKYQECDVAVIFGLVKKSYLPTWAKASVLENHPRDKIIILESAFVLRGTYYAAGIGGIHGEADFKSNGCAIDRWQRMGVKSKKWQKRENGPVVICGQLPRDTNVQNVDHIQWVQDTVKYYSDRNIPLLFRPHPRIDDASIYGIDPTLHDLRSMKETLKEARCVVTWNSTSGVDASIAGVPIITCSPSSMSSPIASHSLDLEKLIYPSRSSFFASLGYAQWTLDEMRKGLPWRHLMRD